MELDLEVERTEGGMGVVMDAASNRVLKVDAKGPAAAAGLQPNDLITMVDGAAVTVLDDGYVSTRSLAVTAIAPSEELVKLRVFRRYE